MITRVCISVNNRCNLNCGYCHFHEKTVSVQPEKMNIIAVLDNIMRYIDDKGIKTFKIGFVGNGEPLLEYDSLKSYILHISDYMEDGRISVYSITNGLPVNEEMLQFFRRFRTELGFSLDGLPEIHNKYRCGTHAQVMEKIGLYRAVNGKYPSLNCTVGRETLDRADETIDFFRQFDTKISFSRMIGRYGIPLDQFRNFLKKAAHSLNIRTGGYDCTMYNGLCGAGRNNFFYANGKVYLCGNCIDLPAPADSTTPLSELDRISLSFDRTQCYRETICG